MPCVCTPICRHVSDRVPVQVELKMVVAMVLSRLHVALDAQRMPHLRTVEDYLAETTFKVTLQRETPAWLRLRPRTA